jgi:hypothetical protein
VTNEIHDRRLKQDRTPYEPLIRKVRTSSQMSVDVHFLSDNDERRERTNYKRVISSHDATIVLAELLLVFDQKTRDSTK